MINPVLNIAIASIIKEPLYKEFPHILAIEGFNKLFDDSIVIRVTTRDKTYQSYIHDDSLLYCRHPADHPIIGALENSYKQLRASIRKDLMGASAEPPPKAIPVRPPPTRWEVIAAEIAEDSE